MHIHIYIYTHTPSQWSVKPSELPESSQVHIRKIDFLSFILNSELEFLKSAFETP